MDRQKLVENSLDLMEELKAATGETVGLAVFADNMLEGEVIASIAGSHSFNFKPEVGHKFPLHATAPGKILLAYHDDKSICQRLELCEFTSKTITESTALCEAINEIRDNGYGLDLEETVYGINCLGAPILDENGKILAALWITGPINRLGGNQINEYWPIVVDIANRVSSRLKGDKIDSKLYLKTVISEAKAYLFEHLDQQINMEKYAEDMKIGYCWFRRNFKKETGFSPNQYHMKLRLDKAKQLLEYTDLSVKEIAIQLGYDSQDYFSAVFKKKAGTSPQNYRESCKSF